VWTSLAAVNYNAKFDQMMATVFWCVMIIAGFALIALAFLMT
jgi:hypothetical protein